MMPLLHLAAAGEPCPDAYSASPSEALAPYCGPQRQPISYLYQGGLAPARLAHRTLLPRSLPCPREQGKRRERMRGERPYPLRMQRGDGEEQGKTLAAWQSPVRETHRGLAGGYDGEMRQAPPTHLPRALSGACAGGSLRRGLTIERKVPLRR